MTASWPSLGDTSLSRRQDSAKCLKSNLAPPPISEFFGPGPEVSDEPQEPRPAVKSKKEGVERCGEGARGCVCSIAPLDSFSDPLVATGGALHRWEVCTPEASRVCLIRGPPGSRLPRQQDAGRPCSFTSRLSSLSKASVALEKTQDSNCCSSKTHTVEAAYNDTFGTGKNCPYIP